METFESQLTRLAQQHKAEIEKKLRPIQNPRHKSTFSQWIAIPVAAVFGLLIGLWLPFRLSVPSNASDTFLVKHDTLYQKIVDTVIVEKEIEKLVLQNTPSTEHSANKEPIKCPPPIEGKNICVDGINYNMLYAFTE